MTARERYHHERVEEAREAERIARRVAREHPDTDGRTVYQRLADRAAAKVAELREEVR
jgi:hypothetical protein